MNWEEIVKTVMSSAVLVAAVAWLARAIVSQALSKDLENHKHALKAETDREISRLQAELQIAVARERTTFDLFHQKRADAVAQVYALLARTHRAAHNFTRPMEYGHEPPKEEKFNTLAEVGNELKIAFDEKRIFFPPDTADEFDELYAKIRLATQTMMDDLRDPDRGATKSRIKAWEAVSKEVPPMLKKLESQFRRILGAPAGEDSEKR